MSAQRRLALVAALVITLATYGLATNKILIINSALADSQSIVSLYADGQLRIIPTDAKTVGDLLKRAGVNLAEGDLVEPGADSAIQPGSFNINVYRSGPVVVQDGDKLIRGYSAYQNAKLILGQLKVELYNEDILTSEPVHDLIGVGQLGRKLNIKRAKPFKLHIDGVAKIVRTQNDTVGEALAEHKIALGPDDKVHPGLGSVIDVNDKVVVTRIKDSVIKTEEAIDRPVQTITDDEMPQGERVVKKAGADGQRQATYLIHFENGKETARKLLKAKVIKEPVGEVLVVGTKVFFGGSVEYWRPQVVSAARANGIDPNMMLRIMQCESGGNANASNGSHFGLFQYDWATWLGAGGTKSNIFDGSAQIKITAWKMANYGTGAWVCK